MRGTTYLLLGVVGVPVAFTAFVLWDFSGMPLQPEHAAMARVVAIAPTIGRSPRQTIIVRNAHGVGRISMLMGDIHCSVGDQVPVKQRGVTLTRAAGTCR